MSSEINLNVKCKASFTTTESDFADPYPAVKYENVLLWYSDIILLILSAAEFYITYGNF